MGGRLRVSEGRLQVRVRVRVRVRVGVRVRGKRGPPAGVRAPQPRRRWALA